MSKRIFHGINRLLPVRFRGESDERYWEGAFIFAAADQDEAETLWDAMVEALGCPDGDHECPHFRFSALRPMEDE